MPKSPTKTKNMSRIVLPLLTLIGIASVALPMVLLNPFRPQTPETVAWAYRAGAWAPWLTVFLLAVGLFMAWLRIVWGAGWLEKGVMAVCLLALLAMTVGSRINMFERMFAPLARPGYVTAAQADHVSDSDLVMGVVIGDQPVAFPVGIVAYHHLVNDSLADEPYVVTY